VLERLVSRDTPFVMLDSDWSAQGVRSIDLMPASHVRTLLDHLADLGHERIACFNTQSEDRAIRGRIGQWEQWMREKGFSGRMINEPVPPYRESRAQAYQTMSNFLQARTPDFTAVFCTTGMCAAGLMRALHDAKIAIGSQLSVCAANDERWAPYLYPTLTSTRMPDPEPFIEVALEWMQSPGESWRKPNVLWPKSATLYIGESTGPAPA
jgi:LacI family transcriptional regulator